MAEFKPAREVILAQPDPTWRVRFEAEAARLDKAWGDEVLAIHHVGSTSIPGIKAKPIIDFLVIVKDLQRLDALNPRMQAMGYACRGENGIPGRRYFCKSQGVQRLFHVHVFEANHPNGGRMLAFRDYLCLHPQLAAEYSQLKERLVAQYRQSPRLYTEAKSEFIESVIRHALLKPGAS